MQLNVRASGPSQVWLLCARTLHWEEEPAETPQETRKELPKRAPKPVSRESGAVAARSGWGRWATRTPLTGTFQFPMELNCKSRESVTVCCLPGRGESYCGRLEKAQLPFPKQNSNQGSWSVEEGFRALRIYRAQRISQDPCIFVSTRWGDLGQVPSSLWVSVSSSRQGAR